MRRCVSEARASGCRGNTRQIDVVLDGERNAIQRQPIDGAWIEFSDIRHDLIAGQTRDPHVALVCTAGIFKQAFHDAGRRLPSGAITITKIRDAEVVWIRHAANHKSPTRCLPEPIARSFRASIERIAPIRCVGLGSSAVPSPQVLIPLRIIFRPPTPNRARDLLELNTMCV